MRRVKTIIREISKLEKELFHNYTSEQIKEAIEECEEDKTIPISCDDLISVIYEGVTGDIDLRKSVEQSMK